jgi:hypothetical protein
MQNSIYSVDRKGKIIKPKIGLVKLKHGGSRQGSGRPKGSLNRSKEITRKVAVRKKHGEIFRGITE